MYCFNMERIIFCPSTFKRHSEVEQQEIEWRMKMKKLEYGQTEVMDETGAIRTFYYYFIVEEINTPYFLGENYGISVEEKEVACVNIPNISTNLQRVEQLLEILSAHKVSPTTCSDVISDWI